MPDPDIRLVEVEPGSHVEGLVAVHEAAASVAYEHIFSDPFPRSAARERWAARTGRTVLAVREGAVLGFAAASPDGTLEGLYVLPGKVGRGLGSRLLQAVEPVTRLWVLEDNTAGRSFYERRGWRPAGVRKAALDAANVQDLLYVR